MKYLYFLILASLAVGVMTYYSKTATPLPTPTSTPQDQTDIVEVKIKEAITEKHGENTQGLEIRVTELSKNYAKGTVNQKDAGGGMWFAVKINGTWELVWDGNGIITCEDLKDYPQFPSSLVPQCFDTETELMVDR